MFVCIRVAVSCSENYIKVIANSIKYAHQKILQETSLYPFRITETERSSVHEYVYTRTCSYCADAIRL